MDLLTSVFYCSHVLALAMTCYLITELKWKEFFLMLDSRWLPALAVVLKNEIGGSAVYSEKKGLFMLFCKEMQAHFSDDI